MNILYFRFSVFCGATIENGKLIFLMNNTPEEKQFCKKKQPQNRFIFIWSENFT